VAARTIERLYIVGGVAALNLLVFHFARLVDLSTFFLVFAFLVPYGWATLLFVPFLFLVGAPFALRRLHRDHEDQKWRTVFGCSVLLLALIVVEVRIARALHAAL